jgi:hypothetical protein
MVLFEQLASNDLSFQLRGLWLAEWLQPSVLVPLNRYLTQTSTLRIVLSRTRAHFHVLAPAFRANGSLVHVQIMDSYGTRPPNQWPFRSFCA